MDVKKSELNERYKKLIIKSDAIQTIEHIKPIYQRQLPDCIEMIFADTDIQALEQYGEVQTPSLEDLFVATNSNSPVTIG